MSRSDKPDGRIEERRKRIEIGWKRCQEWFAPTGDGEENIELRFVGITRSRLAPALKAVDQFTSFIFSGAVWVNRDEIDPKCEGHDAYLAQLAKGNVSAYNINYEVAYGEMTLSVLLSIQKETERGVRVIGYTGHDMVDPEATVKQRFTAVAAHGMDLQEWFQAVGVLIAVRGEDGVRRGKAWV